MRSQGKGFLRRVLVLGLLLASRAHGAEEVGKAGALSTAGDRSTEDDSAKKETDDGAHQDNSAETEANGGAPQDNKLRAEVTVGTLTLGGKQEAASFEATGSESPNVFRFEVHGGVAVYYYQPTNGWDPLFFIYSNLKLTARFQWLGIHYEPRLSSEKMRPYYDSLAWMQEGYVFFEKGPAKLKLGKIYKRVGLPWDGSFYGNIQVYEGLKFDPNVGMSGEARFGDKQGVELSAQYFVLDGHLNASLAGRDTVSIPGARRRNIFAARLLPFFQLSKSARLEVGLSGEAFTADLPEEENHVERAAADVKLTWGKFGMWGEYLHQWGAHVSEYPLPGDPAASPPVSGQSSEDNTYLLAGTEYTLGQFTARYNLSYARYADLGVSEVLHLPGLGWAFHEHATALFEYAYWDKRTPTGTSPYDRSVNLTLMAYF